MPPQNSFLSVSLMHFGLFHHLCLHIWPLPPSSFLFSYFILVFPYCCDSTHNKSIWRGKTKQNGSLATFSCLSLSPSLCARVNFSSVR